MDADFGLFPAVTLVTSQRPDGAVGGRLALLLQEGVQRSCAREGDGCTFFRSTHINALRAGCMKIRTAAACRQVKE